MLGHRTRWERIRRRGLASAGVTLLAAASLAAPELGAATILEKRIRHAVQGDGSVLETVHLRVKLESERDLERWSVYPVYLDEHRTLEEIRTFAVHPDGKQVVVRNKDHDVIEDPGSGALAGSQRYRLVEFPALPVGSEIDIEHRVREAPYFPGNQISLGEEDAIASLEVEITGAPQLRWHLDRDTLSWGEDALKVNGTEGGLRLVGEGLAAVEPPEMAPADADEGPVILYTWGDADLSWQEVATWYQGLVDSLPASAEVESRTRDLVAGTENPRQRLDALLAYAAQKVRYVAVEIGLGGWRPSPAAETVGRGWGDCKDKATLLVEMLGKAGIEAYPALILSGRSERIDAEIPNPFQFNHAIVAVPIEGLDVGEGDPVAEGLLFLDPTDDTANSRWLHSSVQDQDALVVRGASSGLVRTPRLFDRDLRELSVELTVSAPSGIAKGRAELKLTGRYGAGLRKLIASEPTDRIEEVVRSVLGGLLPGANLRQIGWGEWGGEGVPEAAIHAEVELAGIAQGGGSGSLSLRLPGVAGTPNPGSLEDRRLPLVLNPGRVRESWQIALPPGWCPREGEPTAVANEIGSFLQSVDGEDGKLGVERILDLRRRWVDPEDLDALRELSLTETRTRKRRIRMEACGGG